MPDPQDASKRAAARRALGEIHSGMRLGLGTGSTVAHFLELLAEALHAGSLKEVRGVPTSGWTEVRCRELGIPLLDPSEVETLELCVDGADEVDPALDLIKGLGGALVREKIVAAQSARFVVMVDRSKVVRRLGTRAPLPVEVLPFAIAWQEGFLTDLGGTPVLRRSAGGDPVLTDNGNRILDVHFPDGIPDAAGLAGQIATRCGVVGHGLFLGMTSLVLVADGDQVLEWTREEIR